MNETAPAFAKLNVPELIEIKFPPDCESKSTIPPVEFNLDALAVPLTYNLVDGEATPTPTLPLVAASTVVPVTYAFPLTWSL